MRPGGLGLIAVGLIMYVAYPKFTNDYVDGVQTVGLILFGVGVVGFLASLLPTFQQSRRDNDRRNAAALRGDQRGPYDDRY